MVDASAAFTSSGFAVSVRCAEIVYNIIHLAHYHIGFFGGVYRFFIIRIIVRSNRYAFRVACAQAVLCAEVKAARA